MTGAALWQGLLALEPEAEWYQISIHSRSHGITPYAKRSSVSKHNTCALTLRGQHYDHVHSLLSKLVCRPAKAPKMV